MSTSPLTPEIWEPDEELPADLAALRRFAILLDAAVAIPGTRRRIGISSAVGLIPGIGDAFGALMSVYIVAGAIRHRVPARTIWRMLANIVIDLTVGSIPVLGDIFDFFWKENLGNVELLIRQRDRTRPPRPLSRIALVGLFIAAGFAWLALVLVVFLIIALIWLAEQRL